MLEPSCAAKVSAKHDEWSPLLPPLNAKKATYPYFNMSATTLEGNGRTSKIDWFVPPSSSNQLLQEQEQKEEVDENRPEIAPTSPSNPPAGQLVVSPPTGTTPPVPLPSSFSASPAPHDVLPRRTFDSGIFLEQILFFMSGLGSSLGHIATLSSLVYLREIYGCNSFVYLNLAVYLPLLPISVAQARYDQRFDLQHSTRIAFLFRSVVGFSCVLAGTLGLMASIGNQDVSQHQSPHNSGQGKSLWWVVLFALLQGTGGAILFGQLNQLATFVGSSHGTEEGIQQEEEENSIAVEVRRGNGACSSEPAGDALPKKLKATVSAGFQASAVAALAASFVSGFGTMNGERFVAFMGIVLGLEVVCFVLSLWLLARPRVAVSMNLRDVSIQRSATALESTVIETRVSSSSRDQQQGQKDFSEYVVNDGLAGDNDEDASALPLLQTISNTTSYASSARSQLQSKQQGMGEQYLLHSSLPLEGLQTPLLNGLPEAEQLQLRPSTPSEPQSLFTSTRTSSASLNISTWDLLHFSQSSCITLAFTLAPSFLVGSWFTRVQTDWMELAQILFYVRIGSDLVGRFATMILPPPSGPSAMKCLSWTAALRCVAVLVFFLNASQILPLLWSIGKNSGSNGEELYSADDQSSRDYLSIVLVATIAFFSGYLVTSCYQLAPQQLPPEARPVYLAKQASLLTVAFSVSALTGLVTSFVLTLVGL